MYAEVLTTPSRAADALGTAYPGAKWTFFASGTSTHQAVFLAPDLATAHANPVVADVDGLFPPIYFDPAKSYRGLCTNAAGTVVLHDFDPVNSALIASLAAPTGAALVGFVESGTGAVARTVEDKLRDNPVDVADFGALGTSDDTAVFQAAYNAARDAGRPLRLPSGDYRIGGLLFDGPIDVRGAGAGTTNFIPTGNNQTIITITDRGDPEAYLDRGRKVHISGFAVMLDHFSGCTGIKTELLVRTVLERIGVTCNEYDDFSGDNIAWHSHGDQYSTFRDIYLERCRRGLLMTPDSVAGGGINNHFDGMHVAFCLVNAMIANTGPYPMHSNHFTNLRLQEAFHCSLYVNNMQTSWISMLPPEKDTASVETLTIDGFTIRRGTVHADNYAQVRFAGYQHVTNNTAMRIVAENHSALLFEAAGGAAISTFADPSSTIEWEGSWGNGSNFRNTRISLQAQDSSRAFFAYHPAEAVQTAGFPNECVLPVSVPLNNHFAGCSSTLCSDLEVGFAREVTFAAQPGAFNSNAINLIVGTVDFQPGDSIWSSVLLRSDRDTQIGFVLAQFMSSGTIDLKAGQWTRLIASNFNHLTVPRNRIVTFYPIAGDQPVLRLAQPITCRNLTALQVRQLTERHAFNPKDPMGPVLRLAAPPTTGSWHAGTQIQRATPAPGASPGWVCTTAGTPGVWKGMAPLAV